MGLASRSRFLASTPEVALAGWHERIRVSTTVDGNPPWRGSTPARGTDAALLDEGSRHCSPAIVWLRLTRPTQRTTSSLSAKATSGGISPRFARLRQLVECGAR